MIINHKSFMLTKHVLLFVSNRQSRTISTWVSHFAGTVDCTDLQSRNRFVIELFWKEALERISEYSIEEEESTDHANYTPDEYVDSYTRTIKVSKSEFVKTYKETVFTLLEKHKFEYQNDKSLELLQRKIEDLTLNFSEESIYKTCPNIIAILTRTDLPSAKEFLRGKYLLDKAGRMSIYSQSSDGLKEESGASKLSTAEKAKLRPVLSDSDQSILIEFGEYTLECLLVHTLGDLFNLENSVSVASLIDRIESNVRHYASFLCEKKGGGVKNPQGVLEDDVDGAKVKTKAYPFGTALVEFLVSRGLLRLVTYNTDDFHMSDSSGGDIPKTVVKHVVKKQNNYYRRSFVYAECLFNTALLPVKFSLPMVFPPRNWELRKPEHGRMWLNLSDIYGGYLSNPTGQLYSTQRCISSRDAKSFFIYFGLNRECDSYKKMTALCTSISNLQKQGFQINDELLKTILERRSLFENNGLLMPEFLSKVILSKASGILRTIFEKNSDIKSIYKFSEVRALLMKNMQRARYECTIIDLAKAYNGYTLYFPAFLDFRGRIYRSGIFHFHERDLARSLLLFSDKEEFHNYNQEGDYKDRYLIASGFHYKSYKREAGVVREVLDNLYHFVNERHESLEPGSGDGFDEDFLDSLVSHSRNAKRPFQYFSNILLLLKNCGYKNPPLSYLYKTVPVTQDASASAYQLMSYFLLDKDFALLTNLFDTGEEIIDIYSQFRVELIKFLEDSLREENPALCGILDRVITRSIVKKIYMPIIYGKTISSTTTDLIESLSQDVLPKECVRLSTLCFKFWKDRYSRMDSFIELIRLVGRACSSLERPVLYNATYFSTSQDYKLMEKHTVRVFDTQSRKPHNVTLSFPSNVRDKRKTRASTFVNFIHQKDAQIAMSMAFLAGERNIPMYTVHDNFISNTYCCEQIPKLYREVIRDMGPPLTMINRFIYINLIEPAIENGYPKKGFNLKYFDEKIIPDHILNEFLYPGGTPPSEKKNVAGWNKIAEQLKLRYRLYCKVVCEPKMQFADHMVKWERFRKALKGAYCIHH